MVPDVIPLRAIIFQCLLLLVAIAVESAVLFDRLRTAENQLIPPKQILQYAISINLLATVLGWFAIFSFFSLDQQLNLSLIQPLENALLNFVFFNQFSNESLSLLIVLGFITFFASFTVKQVGLWGLQWLLQPEFPQAPTSIKLERDRSSFTKWTSSQLQSDALSGNAKYAQQSPEAAEERFPVLRDLRKDPRPDSQPNINAVLLANALSHSVVLAILLIFTTFAST